MAIPPPPVTTSTTPTTATTITTTTTPVRTTTTTATRTTTTTSTTKTTTTSTTKTTTTTDARPPRRRRRPRRRPPPQPQPLTRPPPSRRRPPRPAPTRSRTLRPSWPPRWRRPSAARPSSGDAPATGESPPPGTSSSVVRGCNFRCTRRRKPRRAAGLASFAASAADGPGRDPQAASPHAVTTPACPTPVASHTRFCCAVAVAGAHRRSGLGGPEQPLPGGPAAAPSSCARRSPPRASGSRVTRARSTTSRRGCNAIENALGVQERLLSNVTISSPAARKRLVGLKASEARDQQTSPPSCGPTTSRRRPTSSASSSTPGGLTSSSTGFATSPRSAAATWRRRSGSSTTARRSRPRRPSWPPYRRAGAGRRPRFWSSATTWPQLRLSIVNKQLRAEHIRGAAAARLDHAQEDARARGRGARRPGRAAAGARRQRRRRRGPAPARRLRQHPVRGPRRRVGVLPGAGDQLQRQRDADHRRAPGRARARRCICT